MTISWSDFSRRLNDSGLMSADERNAFVADRPAKSRSGDGETLARELVQQQKLTKYQAEQISAGNGHLLVLGNYVVLDRLGQGSMGLVLKVGIGGWIDWSGSR